VTALAATREELVVYYSTLGSYLGVCTGSPGTTSTPANEASGGSPAYARVATAWGSATDNGTMASIVGSPVTLNAPAGDYTYALLASAATLAAANMVDWAAINSTTLSAQGQIVLTPTRTEQ
jgi:hypothetical protein